MHGCASVNLARAAGDKPPPYDPTLAFDIVTLPVQVPLWYFAESANARG